MKDSVTQGWVEKPLGEISTLQRGFDLPKRLREPGEFPLVTSSGPTDTHSEAKVKGPGVATGRSGSIGNVFFVEDDFWPLNTALYVKDFHGNDPRFVYHLLNYVDLGRFASGAGVPTLNRNDVHGERYRIPTDIEEQQRIVAVLDEAFEGLARARTHAEANLQNARELFESAIEDALEKAGGEPITLHAMMDAGMITSHLDGNHGSEYPRKAEFVLEGVPYISANCIVDSRIEFGRCKYLTSERADRLRKGIAQNRDVIFAHNATVGPVALLSTDENRVILSTSLTYYRCNEAALIPEFLVYEMRSAGFRRQYEEVMAQATRNQVPITMQRRFAHLIPPIAQQKRIAGLGVELEVSCNAAIAAYKADLENIDDLRQSLLQKAFAGELT